MLLSFPKLFYSKISLFYIKIAQKLLKIGKPVGSIDIVLASVALERNLVLVTVDKDFERIKEVIPELHIRFEPFRSKP